LAAKSTLIETCFAQPQAGETGRWAVLPGAAQAQTEGKRKDFMVMIG
jgi:hypothetical protein